MRKLIEDALREHEDGGGEMTGFLLITFSNGRPAMTGAVDGVDETAEAVISGLMEAVTSPLDGSEDDEDEIGACAGRA